MNYYELVQLADKINVSVSHLIESLDDTIKYTDLNQYTLKKLREIQINAELLKDKLLQLNVNNVIIAADEVKE
tara:strand:- start:2094 stop:2312 length:219 start_codon:yes stop_codon:yes gene_type:complete